MKKVKLILTSLIVLTCLAVSPVHAQTSPAQDNLEEKQAVFDEETTKGHGHEGGGSGMLQDVKEKFHLKLYLDFMYEESLGEAEDAELREADEPSFSSNHTYLMLQASPTDKLRVGFDVQFNEFYEIEYFPVPRLSIKVGKIYLPFGDYHHHPIYGGKVYSVDNDLFPNWFTDFGIGFGHHLLDTDNISMKYDLFVSNGFRDGSDGDINMNAIGFSSDNNSEKALGGRVKTTWFGRYNLTASGMYDQWADKGDASLKMWALDLSTNSGIVALPVLKHINLKLGYLDKHVENDTTTDTIISEYNGFGSHLELSAKPLQWLKLTFRMGEVDPNENVQDKMDQRNYNLCSVFYLEKYLELWAMFQKNEEKYVDEIDNDYIAFKVVLSF